MLSDEDIDRLLKTAAGYAAWCAGMSDEAMMDLLNKAQQTLRAELALKLGPDAANVIAEAFVPAVISARAALEAGATSRGLN